jgi:hypothetical protein
MESLKESNYRECVDRIKRRRTTGDIDKISKKYGLPRCSYYSALKKSSWDELTSTEYGMLEAVLNFYTERDELKRKMAEL